MRKKRTLTTKAAAELADMPPRDFRSWASRHKNRTGIDLHAPAEVWPDARTPLWDEALVQAALKARPGKGFRSDLSR